MLRSIAHLARPRGWRVRRLETDAGYPEMAEQQKPWDESSYMATDAITGASSGAHAGLHGPQAADVDPSIRDAAKVVEDRQEVADRDPGIPVEHQVCLVRSAGTRNGPRRLDERSPRRAQCRGHGRRHLRASRGENRSQAREIMRDEFMKSASWTMPRRSIGGLRVRKSPSPKSSRLPRSLQRNQPKPPVYPKAKCLSSSRRRAKKRRNQGSGRRPGHN